MPSPLSNDRSERLAMPKMHALITALILDRPLCMDCLQIKTRLGVDEVEDHLGRIGEALTLHRSRNKCRSCGTVTDVMSVERPLL